MSLPLRVVCLQTGDSYGDEYVARLASMVGRHLSEPHEVHCIVDRPRDLPTGIRTINASSWGLDGWFNKLRLFDQETFGGEPFLYLDLTLVVKKDLAPLLAFARAAPEPVVGVSDWSYGGMNSCCMWIRPGPVPQTVWDAYRAGQTFKTRQQGDQDYASAVLMPQEGALGYFPEPMVASYKALRRLYRHECPEAARRLDEAIVLKFHGTPKPHQVVDWRASLRLALPQARHRPSCLLVDIRYLANEIRQWWA